MFVSEYNESWPGEFEIIQKELAEHLSGYVAIHHVGSTAIDGMLAKPIIDIDIEIPDERSFIHIQEELGMMGYVHCGDQGIAEREVFKREMGFGNGILDRIRHHLYVCPSSSAELKRHLLFRDYLREHIDIRNEYIKIKKEILHKYGAEDRESYVQAKENDYRWFFDKVHKLALTDCEKNQ